MLLKHITIISAFVYLLSPLTLLSMSRGRLAPELREGLTLIEKAREKIGNIKATEIEERDRVNLETYQALLQLWQPHMADAQLLRKLTFLHHAASLANSYFVEFLLENDADANAVAPGTGQWTPLHAAIRSTASEAEKISIVNLLLNGGADVNLLADGENPSPIEAVVGESIQDRDAIMNLLKDRGARIRPEKTYAHFLEHRTDS